MPSHSSRAPHEQGPSPGTTASHPKGHLERRVWRGSHKWSLDCWWIRLETSWERGWPISGDLCQGTSWRDGSAAFPPLKALTIATESTKQSLSLSPSQARVQNQSPQASLRCLCESWWSLLSRKGRARRLASCCRQPEAFPLTLRRHSAHQQEQMPTKNSTGISRAAFFCPQHFKNNLQGTYFQNIWS